MMLTLDELNTTLETLILPNSLKIINFRRKGTPVAIKCLFYAGSRFDEIEGTAHFLEHMLVAGTKRFPTKDKLGAFIDNYGGAFSAHTGVDSLSIDISIGDPADIHIASKLLEEILFFPLFDNKTIESERKSILKELGEEKSNPSKMIHEIRQRLFFQNTSLSRPILGTEDSIKSISKENLLDFYKKFIRAGQMVLCISGDVSLKEIKKLFAPYLGKINYIQKLPKEKLDICFNQRVLIEDYPKTDQVYLAYGFRTPPVFDRDNPALIILAQFFGSRTSPLMRRLRYEKGFIYSLNINRSVLSDSGLWSIQTSTTKNSLQEVVDILRKEIYAIADNGLSEAEIASSRNTIVKSGRRRLQTSESWVDFHAYKQLFNQNEIWTVEDYFKELEDTDSDSVKKAAKKFLNPEKAFLALCGNVLPEEIQLC